MARKEVMLAAAGLLLSACGGQSPSRVEEGPGASPLVCSSGAAGADEPATVSFQRQVMPALVHHGCTSTDCHGGPFPQSGYDVSSYATLFGPGFEAARLGVCNVVPGDARESYLIHKLEGRAAVGSPMPLGRDPIAPEDLQLLRTWIDEGAPDN